MDVQGPLKRVGLSLSLALSLSLSLKWLSGYAGPIKGVIGIPRAVKGHRGVKGDQVFWAEGLSVGY